MWNVVMDLWERFCVKRRRFLYDIPLELGRERGLHYAQLAKFYSYVKILACIYWCVDVFTIQTRTHC